MAYSFTSKVRYSELDAQGRLSLHSVLNYFQDCCTFHSHSIGQGMHILEKRKRVWVLSGWQVVVDRYPVLAENLVITTWPYDFRGFLGSRNFTLFTEQGERLAYANTLWSYISSETGLPTKLSDEDIRGYECEPRLDMEYAPRRITIPKDGEKMESIPIIAEYLDTNQHVNNAQYVSLAQRFLPEEFTVHQMRAEYKSQVRLGDVLVPVASRDEDRLVVSLNAEGGKLCAVIEFR
ncbi:MAG: thioesterase [Eubacteriales bacterium]|nr:thioesterase [Eubacteriales bacterium]